MYIRIINPYVQASITLKSKMRFVPTHSLLLLLLTLALSFRHFPAQERGFISLDCGLPDSSMYTDSKTGLSYGRDDDYVEDGVGKGQSISSEYQTASLPRQYNYVRSFPGPLGTRGCYSLPLSRGKEYQILLRLGFMYGNYDGKKAPPQFDLYIGANHWVTVKLNDSYPYTYVTEILHEPTSDSLSVCLVNTGYGTPIVSLIELRPLFSSAQSTYNTSTGPLKCLYRWNMGSSTDSIRYKDDSYDRIWMPMPESFAYATNLTTDQTVDGSNSFDMSSKILSTAIEAPTKIDSLNISFTTDDYNLMYFYFSEIIELNKSREVNIYSNGVLWYGPLPVRYLGINTIYTIYPSLPGQYTISIQATENSAAPPILNAFEFYTVREFPLFETDEKNVAAIKDIKFTYNVTKNWQGDPCYPRNLTWTGIECTYSDTEPPSIISLNLSSSELVGSIAFSISRLTKLQSLDLSYNNLTGAVPAFLASLPSLKYLYLMGNNINTSLPPALEEKSRDGSLRIYFQSPQTAPNQVHCGDGGACKKNKNITIIVCSTVGSILVLFGVITMIYFLYKRKNKVVQKGNMVSSKVTSFPYSEVRKVIADNNIIGEGGFATVYYGCMRGVEVAVKVFKSIKELRMKDFEAEVRILATVYHKNLTRIIGYCDEGSTKAIVFEFMPNGNLQDHLSETSPNVLSWVNRLSILIGVGEGLEYLHHGCNPPIIHRDIKPENVLLTKSFEAKLADFGFSRDFPFQSSTVVGTHGYRDPRYVDPSMLTEKVDVYSFGVLMLSVVTGKPAVRRGIHLTESTSQLIQNGDIQHIVDSRLKEDMDLKEARRVVELAMACVSMEASSRPDMHYVVKELKECFPIPDNIQYDKNMWQSPNDERALSSIMSSDTLPSPR